MSKTADYAREGLHDKLVDDWMEKIPENLSNDDMLEIIGILVDGNEHDLARELVELAIEALEESGSERMAELCKGAARLIDNSSSLRHNLLETLRETVVNVEEEVRNRESL